jgi:hypothetical protein
MGLLRNYFWWTYDRGSFHYDVMVTLILAFLFIAPHYINFKDTPAPPVALTASSVLVKHATDGDNRMTFEVRAADLHATDDASRQEALQRIIQPIAGQVTIQSVTPVVDTHGATIAYDADVTR